jgi:hypothetical protein
MTVFYQEVRKRGSLLDVNFEFRKTEHDASADPTLIDRDNRNFDETRLQGAGFRNVAEDFDSVCTPFSSIS